MIVCRYTPGIINQQTSLGGGTTLRHLFDQHLQTVPLSILQQRPHIISRPVEDLTNEKLPHGKAIPLLGEYKVHACMSITCMSLSLSRSVSYL